MKLPGIPLNMERSGEFLLRHGEKILGTVALLGAAWLAWSGIDAMQTQRVREDHAPAKIEQEATRADDHVGRVQQAPRDFLATHEALAERLDAWRSPLPPWQSAATLEVADPPPMSLLDKPLFEELAKRTKPDVFPLEELHAVAGLGLFATKSPAGGRDGEPGAAAGSRLAPYVIVTGLIPAEKQQKEYRGRFQNVGYKEAKRDAPLWSDFELERTAMSPGVPEKWEPIDLAAASQAWARDWTMQPGQPPANWLLAPTTEDARSPQTTPVAFFGPVPARLDDGWGLDDLHPRLVARLTKQTDPGDARQPETRPPDEGPGGPGFAGLPPAETPAAPQPQPQRAVEEPEPYRLFRFIDTNVQSGRAYRYRARLKVWNPNLGLAPQHLANPALAKEQKFTSPPSAASNTAMVPGTTRMLARMVAKDDVPKGMKLKPGTYEILVLAPGNAPSGYALRAVYGELGTLADVESKAARSAAETRSLGEPITTGHMLVDARGRQEPATAPRSGPRKPDRELVPEPLEMLCLRPDGSFEFVSAADAERDVARHAASLPAPDGTKREDLRGPPEEGQPVPEDPFAAPAAGRRP